MVNEKKVKSSILKVKGNYMKDLSMLKTTFGDLEYVDEYGRTLLHTFVSEKYNETRCSILLKTLLCFGIDPNQKDINGRNFIQVALQMGYQEKFIYDIIKDALMYGLKINYVDELGNTILHSAIFSHKYRGNIEDLMVLLCNNNFDVTIKDGLGRNLLEAMGYMKEVFSKYNDFDVLNFQKKYISELNHKYAKEEANEVKKIDTKYIKRVSFEERVEGIKLNEEDKKLLEKFGKILNYKEYKNSPVIGRDDEIKHLIVGLAREKKTPLIIGESGVGKTALVDELAYRIQKNKVPKFLKNKIIYELDPSEIIKGTQYRGTFESNLLKVLKICEDNNILLFIDEIHMIYGYGSTQDDRTAMDTIIKKHIDRSNLKVLGTTTLKEYNEFFLQDALKRRFNTIKVLEPDNFVLEKIINKVIDDYSLKNNLFFENDIVKEQIIKIISVCTDKKYRIFDDVVNNPDLSISIIDDAFAIAKCSDSNMLTVDNFIEAFNWCEKIYDSSKEKAIDSLKHLSTFKESEVNTVKVLKLDFKSYKSKNIK